MTSAVLSFPGAGAAVLLLAEVPEHAHHSWREFTATTWVAVVLAALVTGWVIYKAVMYTLHPGEEEPDHIKRLILSEPEAITVRTHPPVPVSSTDSGAQGEVADGKPAGPADDGDSEDRGDRDA